jgi:hypothetical protein
MTVNLITSEMAAKWVIDRIAVMDQEMTHVLGEKEWKSMRFHHTIDNGEQLFISRIFHLIFLDYSWLQITETVESETMDKRELL